MESNAQPINKKKPTENIPENILGTQPRLLPMVFPKEGNLLINQTNKAIMRIMIVGNQPMLVKRKVIQLMELEQRDIQGL